MIMQWNLRIPLCLIFLYCRFKCEDHDKNQTYECQWYPLRQAHMDRWDAVRHRIENGLVSNHNHIAEAGIKGLG